MEIQILPLTFLGKNSKSPRGDAAMARSQPRNNMLAEHFGLPSPTGSDASTGVFPLQRHFSVDNMVLSASICCARCGCGKWQCASAPLAQPRDHTLVR